METEITLLESARNMNKEALVKIFDLYSHALYSYALRICGDPMTADHIVGDVFAKLLDQLSTGYGPTSNLRSYLYEMTYHRIVDEVRYSQRRVPLEMIDVLPQDGQSTFSVLEDRISFELVERAIRNDLTEDQRHVIILRFLEGLSLRDTATIIGKNVNHVKVIQNRAIATLRKALVYKVVNTTGSVAARRKHPIQFELRPDNVAMSPE